MYLLRLAPATGELVDLRMVAVRVRRMRLERTSAPDSLWLAQV